MKKTIESGITITCVNSRRNNASTTGKCVKSKNPKYGPDYDRTCNACPDDLLDDSTIKLSGKIFPSGQCTSLNKANRKALVKNLIHEIAHNCGAPFGDRGSLEYGIDGNGRPGAKEIELDFDKNCGGEIY